MPFIEINRCRIHYEELEPKIERAEPRTVVMIHGLFANHAVFYRCGATALANKGFRVVVYDLPGHGLSGPAHNSFRLKQMVRDLIALMGALQIEQADLVGYSFGGAVATLAAMLRPAQVNSLTLIEAFGLKPEDIAADDDTEQVIEDALAQYTASTKIPVSQRGANQFREQVRRLIEQGVMESLKADAGFFAQADLRRIEAPVLLLYGTHSPYLDDGYVAESRMRHAELKTASGDHTLPVTKADWVSRSMLAFLDPPDPAEVESHPLWITSHEVTKPELEDNMAIRVRDLRMSYGPVQAVKGINFDVQAGSFFAFLGANGAGKSTTINCLTTLLRPTSGDVTVAGYALGKHNDEIRGSIGVVFQSSVLDQRLSVRENLALRAKFHRIDKRRTAVRTRELVDLLGLEHFIDREYRKLSGGQKRRSDIARALIHRPSIIFLDEPTAGLDPNGREQVWNVIADVRDHEGMTVFLTTHYMEETERADDVCIIDEGNIVAQGTPANLRHEFSNSELTLRLRYEREAMQLIAENFPDISLNLPRLPGDPVRLPINTTSQVMALMPVVWDYIDDFEFRHGSMDDVFLTLTGQRHVEDEPPMTNKQRRRQARALKKQARKARLKKTNAIEESKAEAEAQVDEVAEDDEVQVDDVAEFGEVGQDAEEGES